LIVPLPAKLANIVVQANGGSALLLTEFESRHPLKDGSGLGAFFKVRLSPDADVSRVVVIFDETLSVEAIKAFGLPTNDDMDLTLLDIAEAAIGEHLDKSGFPGATVSGENPYRIVCGYEQFKEWRDRQPVSDDRVTDYILAKTLASYDFELPSAALGNPPDLIRLKISFQKLANQIQLDDGHLWDIVQRYFTLFRLRPRAELLRRRRDEATRAAVSAQASLATIEKSKKRVFVVHGRDSARMNAVARFVQRIGLEPIILHEKPNAGQTLIEKFQANSDVDYAVVLLTPDDLGASRQEIEKADPANVRDVLKPRARQNVYLELGYFLSKLGRGHVGALYVDGVDMPSDYDGVAYIPLDDHEGWHAKLVRELTAAGLAVDLTKL
jgi:predicted nucleotide-binding protein